MTNRIGFLLMLVVFSYTISAQTNTIYFNTKLPGVKPEIFAKGVVSKDDQNEIQAFYSPDGNEFYLVIGWGEECVQFQKILRSNPRNTCDSITH